MLGAVATDGSTDKLDLIRARLGPAADLITEHATAAVVITELFDVLMTNVSAASYEPGGTIRFHSPED